MTVERPPTLPALRVADATHRALFEAALPLSSSLELEVVLERILDGLVGLVPYDVASVMLLKDGGLEVLGSRGFKSNPDKKMCFSVETNPRLRRAIRSDRPIRFTDPGESDPFDGLIDDPDCALKKVHSCMVAPLMREGERIGLMTVDSLISGLYNESHEDSLMVFGTFAAAAIHNSQLMAEIRAARRQLEQQNQSMIEELRERVGGEDLVGSGSAMSRLKMEINLLAPTDTTVLIMGESGTGKELVARSIHRRSRRADRPLIYVNCAAIPENLMESELFGHVRGAYTGAVEDRSGKFVLADGATIFLDEIGDLLLAAQPKLLRVLQEGEIQPVGSDYHRQVDVRVIAATNKNLQEEIRNDRFRSDLFHRLAVYPLKIPDLDRRREDLPELARHFIARHAPRHGLSNIQVHPEYLNMLESMPWPGNVRELEHFIERSLIWARTLNPPRLDSSLLDAMRGQKLAPVDFQQSADRGIDHPTRSLKDATRDFQAQYIRETLTRMEGNVAGAARRLGLDRSNLFRKAKTLGLLYDDDSNR